METSPRIRFGGFEVDPASGELLRGTERIRLQDLPFRLLTTLLERPGELVGRAELGQRLWPPGTFVDYDAGLNTAVAKLREALGDDPDRPSFIETIPKRGYRFIGKVEPPIKGRQGARADLLVGPVAAPSGRRRWPWRAASALVAIGIAAAGVAAYRLTLDARAMRVAVALFDNETGLSELDRVAQTLTDSLVVRLASRAHLAVIGNAAILRTPRPFRDLERIGRELDADFVIIGQVQRANGGLRVLAHLIRVADQAHVWVEPMPFALDSSRLESAIVERIAAAVAEHVPDPR
jgi:DNA-binding winged helix-turn-helix (wHTH) protein/TolB-like protein